MIYFINGLQWTGYKRFDWSVVGESACADSWGRALSTRLPSLSIKAIEGMKALSKNGFRYPFPQYGVQQDVRDGMAVSYPVKT